MTEPFDEKTSLWLRILTPERVRVQSIAHWVQIPTPRGLLGVWPLHAELISVVSPGEVEYESPNGIQRERVDGGMLHIFHGQVLILAEVAEQMLERPGNVQAWEEALQDVEDVLGEIAPGEREVASETQGRAS
jgi:F0F1-type ATP synthase epsilon subunit